MERKTAEALIAGALQDFARFIAEDAPSVLQSMYWDKAVERRLEAFCAMRRLERSEIDHEWRKTLEGS